MAVRPTDGIEVIEGTMRGVSTTMTVAVIHVETRWVCASCKTRWRKTGRHLATEHTCRRCGAQFWLRPPPG